MIELGVAVETAALLTTAAFGLGAHCFVAPCDAGLGLFARAPLRCGQAIVEYSGPRLPMSHLVHSAYALELPNNSGVFIDGNLENMGGDSGHRRRASGERSLAIYTNHSRVPNCVLQHWPGGGGAKGVGGGAAQDTMWIVATESIAAGAELRFDYEAGGSNYWKGYPPRESDWRSKSLVPPPPSGVEPTIDYLPAGLAYPLHAGRKPPWPDQWCE
jgi:hypothetical protein